MSDLNKTKLLNCIKNLNAPVVTVNDHADKEIIVQALTLLVDRIFVLEHKIEDMDRSLSYAANTASCLANGIQPD